MSTAFRNRKCLDGSRDRRVRQLRFEPLEQRTLLATLQITAGLGEQSTLDSVVQTANNLSGVTTPSAQEFDHNDGTAFSKVTLTTAASTTTKPGFNLDVLSNGGVARNGPASVGVQAGLTDASGNLASGIQVMIVASDDSEQKGDPVNVQFAFAFNVKTLAANNTNATFTYSANYTYNGTTTPLAGNTDLLGGSDVTPIGPGPVDLETGTLHAKIGDTFTLTFSENLAGQTIAPFTGSGINNVGWLVDTNLDVSVVPGTPSVVPTSLDWDHDTANGGIDYQYQVFFGTLTAPVSVAFFWATDPSYDARLSQTPIYTDPNPIPAGTPAQDAPSQDVYVPGSALISGGDVPANANYLLVVTDPDNTLGNFDPVLNVTSLQVKFDVPALSQASPPWGPEYLGNSTSDTIGGYGCYMVDLDMALNYNGASRNPLSLNMLLKGTNGFADEDHLNPGPATTIVSEADGLTLRWNTTNRGSSDPQVLRNLLTRTSEPVIVWVPSPTSVGRKHRVLVTGINGSTFSINDPGFGKPTLASYSKFTIEGYVQDPPNDLSAVDFSSASDSASPSLTVTDPTGNVTSISDGVVVLNQIPNAVVFEDGPLEDISGADANTSAADFVYIAQPVSGTYLVQGGATTGNSQIQAVGISSSDGVQFQQSMTGQATGGNLLSTSVNYDPAQADAPTLSISDATASRPQSGTSVFDFNVTLSSQPAQPVTVNYATADGTATVSVHRCRCGFCRDVQVGVREQ